jgi:hypothetical protein
MRMREEMLALSWYLLSLLCVSTCYLLGLPYVIRQLLVYAGLSC